MRSRGQTEAGMQENRQSSYHLMLAFSFAYIIVCVFFSYVVLFQNYPNKYPKNAVSWLKKYCISGVVKESVSHSAHVFAGELRREKLIE